jgi:hypothetical protein
MADDQYLIPPPPKPESTQLAQHPQDKRRANVAIVIAALAVLLTLFQAYEAHRARVDAKAASDMQSKDVERSRKAAEDSAIAANRGADAAWNGVAQLGNLVTNGKEQIRNSEKMFEVEQLPSIGLDGASFSWFLDKSPKMDVSKPTQLRFGLTNSGKEAFGCKIRSGGKFSNPISKWEDLSLVDFPGVIDFVTGSGVSYVINISAPPLLSPASGEVRLYIYGTVSCSKTHTPGKPYRATSCMYFPVSKNGEIVDDLHGCSDGVVTSILSPK